MLLACCAVLPAGGADWGLAEAVEEGSILGPTVLFTGVYNLPRGTCAALAGTKAARWAVLLVALGVSGLSGRCGASQVFLRVATATMLHSTEDCMSSGSLLEPTE